MKKISICILIAIISLITIYASTKITKDDRNLSELALCNVEALANSESDPGKFKWCKTGNKIDYGQWVKYCGNCKMEMVAVTGEGYCNE